MTQELQPQGGADGALSPSLSRRSVLAQGALGAAALLAGCRSLPTPAVAAPGGAPAGAGPAGDWEAKARALLSRHSAVDVHSHPGRFFFKGTPPLDPSLAPMVNTVIPRTLAGMKAGQVAAAVFCTVADLRSLSAIPSGLLLGNRPLAPGEAYDDHRRQVRVFQELVAEGQVHQVLTPADIDRARRSGVPGGILASEGADFLEGRVERLDEAHRDGIRLIGLVHYRRNELGDPQTAPADASGLTPFGAQVVGRMNRLGLLIDLAHISAPAVRRAVEMSTAPMLVSHVMIQRPGLNNPRSLAAEDARLVTAAGGLIGAWPAGIGLGKFNDYIDELLRMVDLFGVAHVAIGTDMDANFQPVFADYAAFPRIPAALLARGMRADEVAKVIGGNFSRVFARSCGGHCRADRAMTIRQAFTSDWGIV
jgi:membrane dipeptidase